MQAIFSSGPRFSESSSRRQRFDAVMNEGLMNAHDDWR